MRTLIALLIVLASAPAAAAADIAITRYEVTLAIAADGTGAATVVVTLDHAALAWSRSRWGSPA